MTVVEATGRSVSLPSASNPKTDVARLRSRKRTHAQLPRPVHRCRLPRLARTVGACGGKPSEDDCKKFADHYVALMTKGQEGPAAEITKQVADGMKPKLIADCEKVRGEDIECSLQGQVTMD
jgi:hypothetical protein